LKPALHQLVRPYAKLRWSSWTPWLADALKLPQYAVVVKEHAVDGEILLDLAERDKLAALKITNPIH
jgi:hypothetical protein